MSRSGNPCDNAAMESWMATYKRERVALAQAAATAEFVDCVEAHYNCQGRPSVLGYQTPLDFEARVN